MDNKIEKKVVKKLVKPKANLEQKVDATLSEKLRDRILDHERFLVLYLELPMWKQGFLGKKLIYNHLKRMQTKYGF